MPLIHHKGEWEARPVSEGSMRDQGEDPGEPGRQFWMMMMRRRRRFLLKYS